MANRKNWEKEFDKKFLQRRYCGDRECEYIGEDKCFHASETELKDFIRSLLPTHKAKRKTK